MRYFISDTHFDDEKAIEHHQRPFSSVDEMNEALVSNWNEVVDEDDVVYHLGDVAAPRGQRQSGGRSTAYWLSQLNGSKMVIQGNHDALSDLEGYPACTTMTLNVNAVAPLSRDSETKYTTGGGSLYLEHQPVGFSGWQLHGHTHVSDMELYPFVNPARKTVNVSVETIDYEPISLDEVVQQIQNAYKNKRYRH